MKNPLNDPIKNPLKKSYEEFWVPIFGRILYRFSSFIEGEQPKERQSFNLRDNQKR